MRSEKVKNISLKQKSIATLLLTLVCCFYCGNTLFMHSHVIDNEIIWHSHPFTSNNHTKSAANTIAQINHLIFTEEVEHVEINPQIITFAPITFFVNNQIKTIVEFCTFLRAPPAYI